MSTDKHRCHPLSLSLRGLMVGVLCVAGWLAHLTGQARRQQQAMAILRANGAIVAYIEDIHGVHPDDDSPWAPAWLVKALGDDYFRSVKYVELRPSRRTDLGRYLRDLPSLRHLDLCAAHASDETLAIVGTLREITVLHIGASTITDRGLAHLRNLPHLKGLYLESPFITDAGVDHLQAIASLESVYLEAKRVTVARVKQMKSQGSLVSCALVWEPGQVDYRWTRAP